jgi:hypothetical protein
MSKISIPAGGNYKRTFSNPGQRGFRARYSGDAHSEAIGQIHVTTVDSSTAFVVQVLDDLSGSLQFSPARVELNVSDTLTWSNAAASSIELEVDD